MKAGKIRPLAICVFRHGDNIFAAEGYDSLKKEIFYRPLGGRIEFGEYGHETVARELMEEIGQAVTNLDYLGTLENIFVFNGERGHEIVRVYDGEFVDKSLYEREVVYGNEEDEEHKGEFKAVWKSLDFFRDGHAPLYPDGLLELLTTNHG
jgi:8-oxo-dGTP pyrophosphatase MutT (NUDIX family)